MRRKSCLYRRKNNSLFDGLISPHMIITRKISLQPDFVNIPNKNKKRKIIQSTGSIFSENSGSSAELAKVRDSVQAV